MGEGELDLLPMMNVFIVLIPMLLTSAVFVFGNRLAWLNRL